MHMTGEDIVKDLVDLGFLARRTALMVEALGKRFEEINGSSGIDFEEIEERAFKIMQAKYPKMGLVREPKQTGGSSSKSKDKKGE